MGTLGAVAVAVGLGAVALIAAGIIALVAGIMLLPRIWMTRRQDRLARETLARDPESWKLLTRADLVIGKYRRTPGILGLQGDRLEFIGLFDESVLIPTDRIRKIITGARLGSGRLLFRLEVLRITREAGDEVEFVLSLPAASAWRSHLGLWAMAERVRDAGAAPADSVAPGRSGESGRTLP